MKQSAIYKIVTKTDYDETNAHNCIKLSSLDEQSGFLHASYGKQVQRTLQKFFKKEYDVLVLELDETKLEQNGIIITPEANKPGGEKYPHLYGTQKIPLKAIKKTIVFKRTDSGEFAPE